MTFCVHCGHAALPDDRSCTTCGSLRALGSEAARTGTCSTCLAPAAPGWRHCGSCGTALDGLGGSRLVRTTIAAEAPTWVPQRSTSQRHRPQPADSDADRWPARLHP